MSGKPSSSGASSHGATLVGVLTFSGALAVISMLGTPGTIRTGWAPVAAVAAMYLITITATAFIRPDWLLGRFLPHVMIGADIVWLALAYSTAEPELRSSPLYLCIMAVAAAALVDRGTLTLKGLSVVLVLAIGLARQTPNSMSLFTNLVLHSVVILGVAEMVFRARRRSEDYINQVADLSARDSLTGLPNRRRLDELMPLVVERARIRSGHIAAAVIDLDHFKQVNDRHGHAAGDALLIQVAQRLEGVCKRSDTWVARLGGEEFVVLAVVDSRSSGRDLAWELHAAVDSIREPVKVTCSVGVAVRRPPADMTVEPRTWIWGILQYADVAMYEAKSSGRDGVVLDDGGADPLTNPSSTDGVGGAIRETLDHGPVLPGAHSGRANRAVERRGIVRALRREGTEPTAAAILPCPTQRHSDLAEARDLKDRNRARVMASMAVLATIGIGIGITLQRYEGVTLALFVGSAIYLAVVAVVMFRWPAFGARQLPLVYLSGLAIWALLVNSQGEHQAVIATSVMMVPVTASAAWMVGRKWLILVFAGVPPALLIGLSTGGWSLSQLMSKVLVDAIVIIMVSGVVHTVRRRSLKLNEEVRTLSQSDALTGLANRRHLEDHARLLAEMTRDDPSRTVAAILLDLDHFKRLNDTRGHLEGDRALRLVGSVVRQELGLDDAAARTGGEEILVLARVEGPAAALAVAERIRGKVESAGCVAQLPITCSIGVALGEGAPPTGLADWAWAMSGMADDALYVAKERGRNQTVAVWELSSDEQRHNAHTGAVDRHRVDIPATASLRPGPIVGTRSS